MKVLWFCNTPSNAAAELGSNSKGGGWISSLETLVTEQTDIELGLLFLSIETGPNPCKRANHLFCCSIGRRVQLAE